MKTKLKDYMPSSIDELLWHPYEEKGEWHQEWIGLGIENGIIQDVNCDSSGDWDISSACAKKDDEETLGKLYERMAYDCEHSQKEYYKYCNESGEDPLRALYVKREMTRNEHWVALFSEWIGQEKHGLAVLSVGRGKTCAVPIQDAPGHVKEWLQIKKVKDRYCMDGIHSKKDMVNAGYVGNGYVKFTITRKFPRSKKAISSDIRRITATPATQP